VYIFYMFIPTTVFETSWNHLLSPYFSIPSYGVQTKDSTKQGFFLFYTYYY
jgi:hypothetical protein